MFFVTLFRSVLHPRPLYRGGTQNFSKSHCLHVGEELGIFPSPTASIQMKSSKLYLRAYMVRLAHGQPLYNSSRSSEFFQVPRILYRGRARNFSKSFGHFPKLDVMGGGSEICELGVVSRFRNTHETCQKVNKRVYLYGSVFVQGLLEYTQ